MWSLKFIGIKHDSIIMNKNIFYVLVSIFYFQGFVHVDVFIVRRYIYSYKTNNIIPNFFKLSGLSDFNIPHYS